MLGKAPAWVHSDAAGRIKVPPFLLPGNQAAVTASGAPAHLHPEAAARQRAQPDRHGIPGIIREPAASRLITMTGKACNQRWPTRPARIVACGTAVAGCGQQVLRRGPGLGPRRRGAPCAGMAGKGHGG